MDYLPAMMFFGEKMMDEKNRQTIGSMLQAAREEQHLSFSKVHEATKISVSYLKAIELDTITDLLPKVYAKGFLKSYAEFLGFNATEIAERFDEEDVSKPSSRIYLKDMGFLTASHGKKEKRSGRFVLLSILVIVAGLLILYYAYDEKLLETYRESSENAEGKNFAPRSLPTKKTESREIALQPSDTATTDQPTVTYELKINAKRNVQVLISIDGIMTYDGILKQGMSEVVRATNDIRIEITDGAAVEILHSDGSPLMLKAGKITLVMDEKGVFMNDRNISFGDLPAYGVPSEKNRKVGE